MKLTKFRVSNFRSVENSDWIETDDITALIGVNESGKTNLLLPLWKLNPAQGGDIEPTSDYPKIMFGVIRDDPGNFCFVEAEFETVEAAAEIAQAAEIPQEIASTVRVKRFFDGAYQIRFPKYTTVRAVTSEWIARQLGQCIKSVETAAPLAAEKKSKLQASLTDRLSRIVDELPSEDTIDLIQLGEILNVVVKLVPTKPLKTSKLVPPVKKLVRQVETRIKDAKGPEPGDEEDVVNTVVKVLPRFVYYSNYGNLDSEIYLPHVVENLSRDDLGTKEAAKARTLHVMFNFVRLKPNEILELGKDFQDVYRQNRQPTPEQIEKIAEQKKTRSILLQSAGAELTKKFRDWWQQGDYVFRFEADGNHFRIWVADERRPTEVELENRSSGLQWFLSFYLVFLVESQGQHKEAVLLLDEPGMGLHPFAQRDLSRFFNSLSSRNQIIYTSHSPFLIDADRLERARKVYVSANGSTKATSDLRHNEGQDEQAGAGYAVYSALNLLVAESFLLGCQPILVEGASDQHYLTAIKTLLVSEGKITPARELVFPPSGGARTARTIASILTGRDEILPMMLLDADGPGKKTASELTKATGLYAEAPERVLSVADFVCFESSETEDLFPAKFLADELDRLERRPETRLGDCIQPGSPFVTQAEQWAKSHSVCLDDYWKVKLAINAKQRALTVGIGAFDDVTVRRWIKLFNAFEQ